MDDSTFPDLAAVLDAGAFPNDDADVQACLIEALVELATDEAGVPRTIELRRSYGPLRRGLSWATDLLEVPSLADRVFDQYDVTFRLEVEQTIDQVRRSHPIYVGRRGDGPGPGAGWLAVRQLRRRTAVGARRAFAALDCALRLRRVLRLHRKAR